MRGRRSDWRRNGQEWDRCNGGTVPVTFSGEWVEMGGWQLSERGLWRFEYRYRVWGSGQSLLGVRLAVCTRKDLHPEFVVRCDWQKLNIKGASWNGMREHRERIGAEMGIDRRLFMTSRELVETEYTDAGRVISYTGDDWSYRQFQVPSERHGHGWVSDIEVHGFELQWRGLQSPAGFDEMERQAKIIRYFLERMTPEKLSVLQQQKVLTIEPEAPTPHAKGGRVYQFPGGGR